MDKRERVCVCQRCSTNNAGPEPAILDWYGHCDNGQAMHSVDKLGRSRGMLPQDN